MIGKAEAVSWLLDSEVLSQPMKLRGNPTVIAWLEREQDNCYTSSIVIAQIAYWVRTKEGVSPTRLQQWFESSIVLKGRI